MVNSSRGGHDKLGINPSNLSFVSKKNVQGYNIMYYIIYFDLPLAYKDAGGGAGQAQKDAILRPFTPFLMQFSPFYLSDF